MLLRCLKTHKFSIWRTLSEAAEGRLARPVTLNLLFLTFLNSTNNKIHIHSELWDVWSKAEWCKFGWASPSGLCSKQSHITAHLKVFFHKFWQVQAQIPLLCFSGVQERLWGLQESFPKIPAGEGPIGGVDQDPETSRGFGMFAQWRCCSACTPKNAHSDDDFKKCSSVFPHTRED